MRGDYGESLANLLLGQHTTQGQLFETVAIGGRWPTIDIYAEIASPAGETMHCFFQVKSTELGYTVGGRRLRVQASARNLNRLSKYHGPTYLIGVDYNTVNPPQSLAYIKTIRGNYARGISNMDISFPVSGPNLILLRDEIETYWTALNVLNHKTNYLTNF